MRYSVERKKNKVAVIGVGNVGASIAYTLMIRKSAWEIVLIDADRERAEAEAKDISHGIEGIGSANVYAGDYSDCAGCDLIIITAGKRRTEEQSRRDVLEENLRTAREITDELKKYYTKGVILVVSNPVDIITHKITEWMELPDGMVFGTGCMQDTSRFMRILSDRLGIGVGALRGAVVGEHGEGQVVLWSRTSAGYGTVCQYCRTKNIPWNSEVKDEITERVRNMGADIISGKGFTQYGITTCVCILADAVINQKPVIASVTSTLTGEYGVEGVSLSVESMVGENGVSRRMVDVWDKDEIREFRKAADEMKEILESDTVKGI